MIDAQGFSTFASSVSALLAFGWLLRSRSLPLIPDVLGERETLVYSPPHATDYTTSVSPVSPFPALDIAKMSSLIAESPHQRAFCV